VDDQAGRTAGQLCGWKGCDKLNTPPMTSFYAFTLVTAVLQCYTLQFNLSWLLSTHAILSRGATCSPFWRLNVSSQFQVIKRHNGYHAIQAIQMDENVVVACAARAV
jgi:hypothetical protein